MNWTPGPWKIDTDTQGYVVIVAGKRTVCLVGPEEDPTSETDAAAIVLLPELAEALKECEKYYLPTPLLCRIRSLLGKMEGTNES